ncbi:MAG: YihY/virulence factor BrkB family protein [Candidatus Paceibacterota bacterium]
MKNIVKTLKTHIPHLKPGERIQIRVRAAAGTYYALFVLAPLTVGILLIGGMFIGGDALKDMVLSYVSKRFGSGAVPFFDNLTQGISLRASIFTLAITVVVFAFGIARFMTFVRGSISSILENTKAEIELRENHIIRARLTSIFYFILILIAGSLLIAFQVAFSIISGYAFQVQSIIPVRPELIFLVNAITNIFSLSVIIAPLYYLVKKEIGWRSAFIGGLVSAILISLLNVIISIYVSASSGFNIYGAYGFVIILFMWLYYSMYAIFYGAHIARNES